MAVKNREYIFSIDSFNKPVKAEDEMSMGLRLLELIMMEPGSNPLHPEMGVGIRNYRFGITNLTDLENRITNQIETYLPDAQLNNVAILRTPDKVLNVEIEIAGNVYKFDSGSTANPVTIDDISG